ncbi:hypothetical protein F2P81_000608 [Scophthalmus maximus]|uniref:Uncharacterized protein n=1 Tax=Scophthalmus maximus TaxID=52904 RepID=A0A6A4TNV7_SCOMX|nr:hypothetical protein F2P81_000608 [Scophthalmus maximus]
MITKSDLGLASFTQMFFCSLLFRHIISEGYFLCLTIKTLKNLLLQLVRAGGYSCGDGFGRDVDLDIIGVEVEVKSMFAYDISEWQDVKDEKERTKQRTLGDAL